MDTLGSLLGAATSFIPGLGPYVTQVVNEAGDWLAGVTSQSPAPPPEAAADNANFVASAAAAIEMQLKQELGAASSYVPFISFQPVGPSVPPFEIPQLPQLPPLSGPAIGPGIVVQTPPPGSLPSSYYATPTNTPYPAPLQPVAVSTPARIGLSAPPTDLLATITQSPGPSPAPPALVGTFEGTQVPAAAFEIYQVPGGGYISEQQLGQQLQGAGYPGPWDLPSMLAAYAHASAPQTLSLSACPGNVLVQQVGGAIVSVPAKVVNSSAMAASALAQSGYPGVNTQQHYVAGTHPATAQSPAGGGVYAGLNDSQTRQLFQNTYGSNWQSVWTQQHAAAVAANGG